MAANAPIDINTLANWETVFEQHSVPQVRALHRQLQSNLSVNREKLRALVGESYRDLLRTAEKIIEMDGSSQQVESNLADAARNCSWRLLERKGKNARVFCERAVEWLDREKYAFAAQISVLQGCPKELAKILYRGGSCILAARVFVISRLLLKSLQSKGSIPLVISLRDQLTSIRGILLRHIDDQLRQYDTPLPVLIESMCALALVKTSSPADLLRHFLNIRSSSISGVLNQDTFPSTSASASAHSTQNAPLTTAVLTALRLFDKTIRDTEALFPKKISEALYHLKSKPLFDDAELRGIPGLNLDTHERLLPEDIRGFIPWVRHDELERSKVHDPIKAWAGKELEVVYKGVEAALGQIGGIDVAVEFRRELLGVWRANGTVLWNVVVGSEMPRKRVRELVGERLERLVEGEVGKVADVAGVVARVVKALDEKNIGSTNLWSDTLVNMRTSNGALAFRQAVKAAIKGHDSSLQSFIDVYTKWTACIVESNRLIASIKKAEKVDEFDDDGDGDDEFGLGMDSTQDGVEDAEKLAEALKRSLEKGYEKLEEEFKRLVGACEVDLKGHTQATTVRATFLYRAIREIKANPPRDSTASNQLPQLTKPLISLKRFSATLIPRLQLLISSGTSSSAIALLRRSLGRRKWEREAPSKPLWEGPSEAVKLPVQPSPDIFKFLHELVVRMAGVGGDVWTKGMVRVLREAVAGEVWSVVAEVVGERKVKRPLEEAEKKKNVGDGEENGEKAQDKAEEKKEEDKEGEGHENPNTDTAEDTTTTTSEQEDSTKEESTAPPPPPGPEISETWVIQLLYDIAYLKKALYSTSTDQLSDITSTSTSTSNTLDTLQSPPPPPSAVPGMGDLTEVFGVFADGGDAAGDEGGDRLGKEYAREWIEGKAGEYWKRTSLLFALLAV